MCVLHDSKIKQGKKLLVPMLVKKKTQYTGKSYVYKL